MDNQLFKKEDLENLCRPTMDRALEELGKGNYERVRQLCEGMKSEWIFLHDMMVEGTAAIADFVVSRLGEEALSDMNRHVMENNWRKAVEAMSKTDPRRVVLNTISTWRAHSCSGVGKPAGQFSVREDDEKFTFTMDPCGSAGRMWRKGYFGPPRNYGLTKEAYPWSFNLKGFPYYCVHCSLMNELLPIEWIGYPINPMEPPQKAEDPCIMYYYKDPKNIPAKYWERYNLRKEDYVNKIADPKSKL